MGQNVIVEELTLKPIGKDSQEIGFKPIRITIDGRPQLPIFDARDIAAIKTAVGEK